MKEITLYFSDKPFVATELIPFIGTPKNSRAHTNKDCSGLRKAKKIHKIKIANDFDVLPCRICMKT